VEARIKSPHVQNKGIISPVTRDNEIFNNNRRGNSRRNVVPRGSGENGNEEDECDDVTYDDDGSDDGRFESITSTTHFGRWSVAGRYIRNKLGVFPFMKMFEVMFEAAEHFIIDTREGLGILRDVKLTSGANNPKTKNEGTSVES